MINEVWCVPLGEDLALIYAPFHGVSTLVNAAMAEAVSRCLENEAEPVPENAAWINDLRRNGNCPDRHRGDPDPLFLGLIPTRGCMMRCAYCDFTALQAHPVMSFDMIRRAADGYAEVLQGRDAAEWNIHFFGGEPFAAFKEVVFAVNYARRKAAEAGVPVRFEVTTNGFYSEEKARWIAENIDTVVLSLDGFPGSQNRHRPGPQEAESFSTVCRSADIFSRGSCEFIIRSCISAENAGNIPDWAEFLAERWEPSSVCLEPMIESAVSRKNGLTPPDPLIFAKNWAAAQRILRAKLIPMVYSSGDISECKNSLCPVGRDALIVDPEGQIGSCWQLAENQQNGGTGRYFGHIDPEKMRIDEELLEKQRADSEENRENCRGCFCYAHCAGGCLLNQKHEGDFCRLTKVLTLWQLLDELGYGTLADELLTDDTYQRWLAGVQDFRCGAADFADVPVDLQVSGPGPDDPRHPEVREDLPPEPAPEDAAAGWVRDGSRIILANLCEDFVKVLEGEEALRFQLDHSGMNKADIEAVWNALRTGTDPWQI